MGFATSYLKRHQLFQVHISEPPSGLLRFVVVIPVYNEDRLLNTLISLYSCDRPKSHIEVFLVFNSSETDPEKIKNQNLQTINNTKAWISERDSDDFKFHIFHFPNLPKKFAGAGLARKIGMDAAVWRFNQFDHQNGIILSLDADTLCSPDYFKAIELVLDEKPETDGFNIYFEHPLSGNEFNSSIYRAVAQYELHLRYYVEGLRYAGFPYAFHTVGSCFGVNAAKYCAQGGMNRRQAGEDFYFLHKIIPLGKFTEINTTTLYPSPRPSSRVPFGTGPVIQKLTAEKNRELETFNPAVFDELKKFLLQKDLFFNNSPGKLKNSYAELPESMRLFIDTETFVNAVSEINANCKSISTYKKRFYRWFNAFRVFKFLNFCSENIYPKTRVMPAAGELLKKISDAEEHEFTYFELLKTYRNIQRQNTFTTSSLQL